MLRNRFLEVLAVVLAYSAGVCGVSGQESRRTALSPEESRAEIVLASNWEARLLAHEPQCVDPVEVAFDDSGRMWVVEMRDYPYRLAELPRGRIRILSDTDGDGRYETSQVFADGLEMPTGLAFWQQGVLVTVAGQMLFLSDSDGDGVADRRQVWIDGFSEDNEQLRANHPRLGPDGLWYIASGLRGGEVRLGSELREAASRNEPAQDALKIGSRDVRFDPQTNTIDLVTGPAQFGLCFDLMGNRYFCSNRNPAVQVVFEQQDLDGNPLAGLAPSVMDVLPAGEDSRVFPLINAWTTSHLHAGQFTAACGLFVRPLPEVSQAVSADELHSEFYVCEPTGCLVKRQELSPSQFRCQPLPAPQQVEPEWLASRDEWFRPVNVTLAPDGEMVIVDMHRAVIEHPQWVPEELKHRIDERWGDDAGRIYWVGAKFELGRLLAELRRAPLGSRETGELVQLVADPNPWIRETAARLLLERNESEAIGSLMSQGLDENLPLVGRVRCLQLAVALSRRIPSGLVTLFGSENPLLAEVALRLARQYPTQLAEHSSTLARLCTQGSEVVQFHALLGLGRLTNLGHLALSDQASAAIADRICRGPQAYALMAAAAAYRDEPSLLLFHLLQALPAAESASTDAANQGSAGWREAAVRALTSAAIRGGNDLDDSLELAKQLVGASAASAQQHAAFACLLEFAKSAESHQLDDDSFWDQVHEHVRSRSLAGHVSEPTAIALLGCSPRTKDRELLGISVRQNTDPDLNGPLLTAWANTGAEDCDEYLVAHVNAAGPQLQRVMLSLIGNSQRRLNLLSQRMQAGEIAARQLGSAELQRLVSRAKGETQKRLQAELDKISNSDRAAVVERYKECLDMAGDAERGQQVFRQHCAACHRIGEIGVQVGPDISDSRTKKPLELLTSILNPNLAIDNNYFRFVVLTRDGQVIEGIMSEETSDAIVIRGQDNRRDVVRRAEIEDLKATGVSMMPEGIEAQIGLQQMSDLIAFIKGWRYIDGIIPQR